MSRLLVFLAAAAAMLALPGAAGAATITVTTTADGGPGSLRAAVTAADNATTATTIVVPAGHYTLTGAAGENDNASGDLDLDGQRAVTIAGAGARTTILDGGGVERVIDDEASALTLTITGVTV